MSKLSGITNLRVEDVQNEEARKWLPSLLLPLNQFLTQTSAILNNGVLFGDNILSQTKAITIAPGSALPVSFKYSLTYRPAQLIVCKATKNDLPVILVLSWQILDTGMIELTNIIEVKANATMAVLDATATYNLTIRVCP